MKSIYVVIFIFSAFFSFSQTKFKSDTVDLYLEKAASFYQKEVFDSSIFWSQEAMLVASRHHDKIDYTHATLWAARSYQVKKDYIISLEYFLKALQTSKLTSDTLLQQKIYFDIGELYSKWGIYSKSVEYYQFALNLGNLSEMYQKILERVATHSILLHEYKEAMYFYEELEKIQDYDEKAYTLEIIANLLAKEQEYQRALIFKKQALTLQEKKNNEELMAKLYNDIGVLNIQIQEYEEAQLYFEKSLELAQKFNDNEGLLHNYIDLGLLYDKKKQYWKAISFFKKALIFQKNQHNTLEIANTYNYLSKLYLNLGEVEEGKKYADLALNLVKNIPVSKTLENTYQLYSAIYKAIHKKQEVVYYDKKIIEVREILTLQEAKDLEEKRLKLREIQKEEKQIQDLLRYQEITELEYRALELERLSKEKALTLLQKDQQLKQLSLENEIILKEKVKKDLLLAQKELESVKKINIIDQLRHDGQLQNLRIERQQLIEKENQQKLASLKKQKEFDELALKNKENELINQKKAQNILILSFIVIVLIIVIIAVILGMRIIYRQKTKELKLTQEKNRIEHQLFRSQMNPHFLFNAMNSIQSFIISEDSLSAHSYLAKFARLMRLILDNSSQEFIPLEQEINTLQLYLELEKLRFENKFDFSIDISKDVDEEFIGIPPMLIQPFVENAILHGLMTKKINGQLTIMLEEKNNQLYCSVIDNGIGRKQAQELQKMRPKKHKSRAIELTQKRLAIFQKQYNQPTYINVVDLYDENDKGIGTKVELLIPMIEI